VLWSACEAAALDVFESLGAGVRNVVVQLLDGARRVSKGSKLANHIHALGVLLGVFYGNKL